jgi:hypothetical protein
VEFLTIDRREREKLQFFVRGLLAARARAHSDAPVNQSDIPALEFRTNRNPPACEVLQTSEK